MESSRVSQLLTTGVALFARPDADLALGEGEIVFRPRASEAAAATFLLKALESEVAEPLFSASSPDEFLDRFADCLGKFAETRAAYRVLARQGAIRFLSVDEAIERLSQRESVVGGPEMVDVFRFALRTVERAHHLAQAHPIEHLQKFERDDFELWASLVSNRELFQCSQYLIFAASERPPLPGVVHAMSMSFEFLRYSALAVYAAVRGRIELRRPPSPPVEPLPFDAEDHWLANLTTLP